MQPVMQPVLPTSERPVAGGAENDINPRQLGEPAGVERWSSGASIPGPHAFQVETRGFRRNPVESRGTPWRRNTR